MNTPVQRLRKISGTKEETVKLIAWGSHGIVITGGFYKQLYKHLSGGTQL